MVTKPSTADAQTGEMERQSGRSKERRLGVDDWKKVEEHLKNELSQRKSSPFRQRAEARWMEVDRQVAMEPMTEIDESNTGTGSWHTVVELGELSSASTDASADVVRILFPTNRDWMQAHAEIPLPPDAHGNAKLDAKLQSRIDGRLRSLMIQQHKDFGFLARYRLSLKEAFHHGSYVAEVDWGEQQEIHDGTRRKTKGAPVWIPHSMWNCYPDMSPSVIACNQVYDGSMFIESYLPRHKAEALVKSGGEGWMRAQWKKVGKDEHTIKDKDIKTKDVKLVTFWGDIVIPRTDGDIEYPNSKAVTMNGTLVYLAPNETPYPPIVYSAFERLDVRDPYGTSPLIKMSPTQKLMSESANQYMNGVMLSILPPIVYDGNDPDFVLNGGPVIEPGSKTSTKGQAAFKTIEVGNPQIALQGLQFFSAEMKDKLGQPFYKPTSDRQTATQVDKMDADEEVGILDFIAQQESSLTAFLFMQHQLNLKRMDPYPFYCAEMDDQDFIRISRQDLPKSVVFEVVGAKGVLGERRRAQAMSVVTAFASGNQLFAPLLDAKAILVKMYEDAGVRNPEQFLADTPQMNPAMLAQQLKQAQAIIQKLGAALQEEKKGSATKMAKIQSDHQAKMAKISTDHEDRLQKMVLDFDARMKELGLATGREVAKVMSSREDRTHNVLMHLLAKSQGVTPPEAPPGGEVPQLVTRDDLSGSSRQSQEAIRAMLAENASQLRGVLEGLVAYLERPKRVEVVRGAKGRAHKVRKGDHTYDVERDANGRLSALNPEGNA